MLLISLLKRRWGGGGISLSSYSLIKWALGGKREANSKREIGGAQPKEHKQLPERSWLDIVVLILAAPVLNTVTRKILTEVIYRADFSSIANLLPPP